MKFARHLLAFTLALSLVFVTLFIFKNEIFSTSDNRPLKIKDKSITLEKSLNEGDIVVFGSSELLQFYQRFLPDNFFNNELNIPLVINGIPGHQSFAITSKLAGYYDDNTRGTSKIAVIISPAWFGTNGTPLNVFLRDTTPTMLKNIFFNKSISKSTKTLVSRYLLKNFVHINSPSLTHYYGALYGLSVIDKRFLDVLRLYASRGSRKNSALAVKNSIDMEANYIVPDASKLYRENRLDEEMQKYKPPNKYKTLLKDFTKMNNLYVDMPKRITSIKSLDKAKVEALKREALEIDLSLSTNNPYGMTDYVYTRDFKLKEIKGQLPIKVEKPNSPQNNKEYQDFLKLIEVCKMFDIKPIFIMQNLNPLVYENLEPLHEILTAVKEAIVQNGFAYLDLWSWSKEDYVYGEMIDATHPSEYTWVKIDNFIYEQFVKKVVSK